MKLDIEFGGGVISLPEKTLDILNKASELEIKLLVLLASDKKLRDDFSSEGLADALSSNTEDITKALKYLSNAGLISVPNVSDEKISVRVKKAGDRTVTVVRSGGDLPTYTGPEIEEIFRKNDKPSGLVDTCQRVLGKMLTLIEINKIIALYDFYRLDASYIELLAKYAVKIGKPSVPYLDKMARELYNQGVTTAEMLEVKLRELEKISELEGFVRKLFGLGERKLTAKEAKFVEQWVSFGYPNDMIELAYEITIDNGKGVSLPYMNKVLTNWRDAGHKTAAEVISSIEKYRQNKNGLSLSNVSDTDSIEKAILTSSRLRAQKQLEKNKND